MALQRIVMLQNGKAVPRFHSEPSLSTPICGWKDLRMERHHLTMNEECAGVTDGYQICLNVGPPAPVHWKVNGRPHSQLIGAGQLSIASHGNLRIVRWHKPMQILLLSLSTRLMMEYSAQGGQRSFPELIERLGHRDTQIETLLHLLHSDLANGSPAGILYGEQLGVALVVYLTRCFGVHPNREKQLRSSLPGVALKRIYEYVEAHLSLSISLDQLAEQAGMSRFHFSRLFRNSTGQTPSQFVTQSRVERAKTLLTDGTMTLREIADATGFSSQSHLTSIFKVKTGGTPARYRFLTRRKTANASEATSSK